MWTVDHDEAPTLDGLERAGIGVPSCPEGGSYALAGKTVSCSKHQ
jgi:hypothetical protein